MLFKKEEIKKLLLKFRRQILERCQRPQVSLERMTEITGFETTYSSIFIET